MGKNNKKPDNRKRGYTDFAYAPIPTKRTVFFRKCILWQAYRFVVLNVKILRIVVGGHS